MTDIHPDARLNRKETAKALTAHGFKTAESTLASLATRGGGPPFSKWGKSVSYKWADALAWAERRLTAPVNSTAEFSSHAA